MGSSAPEQLVPNGVTGCAAGIGHSLLIKSDGTLWGMGYNWSGQLGDGGTNLYYYYSARLIASDVVAAAAGNAHSLFVQANGSLWVMGDNANGELGDGTTNASHAAKEILASEVTAVAAGLSHSLFLKSDGSVWGMGANAFGQLGDGTTNSSFTPKQIIGADVIAISAGEYHSLFLESDGSLWATGWNERGQLGVGTNDNVLTPRQIVGSDVKAVVGGGRHTLFLRTDGSLWGMGYAHLGQLGDGALLFDVKTPTQILSNGVTVIASGSYHSLFVKEDGTLWGMGNDYYGELGGGLTRDKRVFPVLVSPRVTFTATPKVGVSPLSVQFTAPGTDSEGNAVNAWSWNFGDGSASVAQNPSHVYASTNSNFLNNSPVFVPALTVTNGNGLVIAAPGPSIVLAGYTGLVLNGGFETGDYFGWATNAGSGHYETITASHSGKYSSRLTFSASVPVNLSQTLTTIPDAPYAVSFWLQNLSSQAIASNNVFRVIWDGNTVINKTNPASSYLTWEPFQFVARASRTNTVLQFQFLRDAPSYSSVKIDDVVVLPQPIQGPLSLSGTNFVLTVSNGLAGLTYYVLMTTNLALPLNQWTKMPIGNLNTNSSFSIVLSNPVNSDPLRFFGLQATLPSSSQNPRQ